MSTVLIEDHLFPGGSRRLLAAEFAIKLCPFQPPIMTPAQTKIQHAEQSFIPVYRGCGSWCPLFDLHRTKDGKADKVTINCGAVPVSMSIDDEILPEKVEEKPKGTILSIPK